MIEKIKEEKKRNTERERERKREREREYVRKEVKENFIVIINIIILHIGCSPVPPVISI